MFAGRTYLGGYSNFAMEEYPFQADRFTLILGYTFHVRKIKPRKTIEKGNLKSDLNFSFFSQLILHRF